MCAKKTIQPPVLMRTVPRAAAVVTARRAEYFREEMQTDDYHSNSDICFVSICCYRIFRFDNSDTIFMVTG